MPPNPKKIRTNRTVSCPFLIFFKIYILETFTNSQMKFGDDEATDGWLLYAPSRTFMQPIWLRPIPAFALHYGNFTNTGTTRMNPALTAVQLTVPPRKVAAWQVGLLKNDEKCQEFHDSFFITKNSSNSLVKYVSFYLERFQRYSVWKKVQLLGATLYIMNSNKSNISITLNKNYFVGTAQLLSRLSDNLRLTAVDLFCAIVQQQLSESLNCRANCNHRPTKLHASNNSTQFDVNSQITRVHRGLYLHTGSGIHWINLLFPLLQWERLEP